MGQVINCEPEAQRTCECKKTRKFRELLNKHLLTIITLTGVISGSVLGTTLRSVHFSEEAILLISYPGELFLRILKFLTLPLLLSCLITVSASINPKVSGKMTVKTVTYFAMTSFISAVIAILMALIIQPGNVMHSSSKPVAPRMKFIDSMLDLGRNFFPDNMFQSFFEQVYTVYKTTNLTNGNVTITRDLAFRSGPSTLGLVTFCILFGSVLNTIGAKGKVIKEFFEGVFEVLMKLTTIVMWLSGVGMCSIITGKLLSIANLPEILSQLAVFVLCVSLGLAFHQLVMLPLIYFICIRKNPFAFYSKLADPWITAFGVSSSAVALPVATQCMVNKAKTDERISKFVLSLGVTLNNNGTAFFLAVSTIFIARITGITLDLSSIAMILLVVTACSMSMPSVPGGALLILLVVLTAVDVDPQNVSLLFAIDWILDRLRTTSNVIGNCFAAAIIEKTFRKELEALDAEQQAEDKLNQVV